MISLVNLIGFLIQMIVCPLVMLPWLFIRLIIAIFNAIPEKQPDMELTPASVFGVSFN